MKASTATRLERVTSGEYRITGNLGFDTVREVLKTSEALFDDGAAQLAIDLSAVQSADSAGLALLIEWYRTAARCNKQIRFVGAPAQLKALAKISDIDTLLPFA